VGDLLRQGGQWLAQMRTTHCASPVTYRRPSTGSGQAAEQVVNATLGRTEYEVQDDFGPTVGAEATDFLILTEELAPVFGEPQAGDRIMADGAVYEVLALPGQGHWRWSDPYRTTVRIHTKQVGADI
jgi:hypothetical protein